MKFLVILTAAYRSFLTGPFLLESAAWRAIIAAVVERFSRNQPLTPKDLMLPFTCAHCGHTAEGDDDMPAHIRTALTTVNLSVPVADGNLRLGTWQGIFLWEHRTQAHARRIVAHLLGE